MILTVSGGCQSRKMGVVSKLNPSLRGMTSLSFGEMAVVVKTNGIPFWGG